MTPQEQELIKDLFDRLSQLESRARDPAAERLIAQGLARAPRPELLQVGVKSPNRLIDHDVPQTRLVDPGNFDGSSHNSSAPETKKTSSA